MANTIQKTTDYDQFKSKKGNRTVVRQSVNRLIASIQQNNMLPVNPIIVNKNMEVIDGQHRLEAARRLNIPIYYAVFDPASLSEIQLLNANVKVWTSNDFLESYVATGRKEYKQFKDFKERFNFPLGATLLIITSPQEGKKIPRSKQLFREGKLQITDLEASIKLAEEVKRLFPYVNEDVKSSNRFYEVIVKIIINYPELYEKMIMKLAGTRERIYHGESMGDYTIQFEAILNRGNTGKRIIIY